MEKYSTFKRCPNPLGFGPGINCCQKICEEQNPAVNCCTESDLCGDNEGICESNAQCKGSLRCGINNCPEGFPPNSNCCTSLPCDAGTYL